MTPPVGPEANVAIGRRIAAPTDVIPPEDCMMSKPLLNPLLARVSESFRRYRCTLGPTYAFTTVVEMRSNSGAAG